LCTPIGILPYGTLSGMGRRVQRTPRGKDQRLDQATRCTPVRFAFVIGATPRPGAALLLAALVVLLATLLPVRADEIEDLYAELMRRSEVLNAELQTILHEIDNPRPIPEAPERVLSLRRNAAVTIGGELRTNYIYSSGEWRDPFLDPAGDGATTKSRLSGLDIQTARLMVEGRAGDRWRVFFDINLQGYNGRHRLTRTINPNSGLPMDEWTNRYDRDEENDILSQAYVEMMKASHSGFGFIVGKVRLPFGLWNKRNLFAQSYMDGGDLTTSYLMQPEGWNSSVRLPHASRLVDPPVAAMLTYEMRDIIRFEAAMFRETERIWERRRGDGTFESRDESGFMPRSWQVGVSLQPLEGWELTAHYRNRHSRGRNLSYWSDSPYRWDFRGDLASGAGDPRWDDALGQWSDTGTGPAFGSTRDEQSLIVGLAVEIPNTNLTASVEYAKGWNQGFNEHIKSEGVNVGLGYRILPRLTLHAQGEWLHVRDRSWMAQTADGAWQRDRRDNNLYRFLLGAEYEVARSLTIEAGWQYEQWRMKSEIVPRDDGGKVLNRANTFYMGTRFIF
ncbi:MAG: hypothetical protein LIQ31_16520, partial [Planctomycetes bacterium]|nr:hypothetical protein [Planctomycetota bacterium]